MEKTQTINTACVNIYTQYVRVCVYFNTAYA